VACPEDLLGKFVDWPNASALSNGRNARPTDGVVTGGESVALNLAVWGGTPLAQEAASWSVKFLKYVAGAVTAERYTGHLLTGSMSGCYTFRYRFNGEEYISHVGTGASAAATLRPKKLWKDYAALRSVTEIWGLDDFFDADVVQRVMQEVPGVAPTNVPTYHYYDPTSNAAYAICLAKSPQPGHLDFWKVVRVKKLTALPWAMIKMGGKFRSV
jgi:hypothetical protein